MDRELINAFGLVAVALALGITVSANANGLAAAGLLSTGGATLDAAPAASPTAAGNAASAGQPVAVSRTAIVRNPRQAFQRLDRDGNGYLSGDEARASQVVARQLPIADFDADARLSIAEFNALRGLLEDEYAE